MKTRGFTRVENTKEAEEEWRKTVNEIAATALWGEANSWYMGKNIPGKPVESLHFTGGVPLYMQYCQQSVDEGYKGFSFA